VRRLSSYVARYGPEVGPRFYDVLQSQAAHAGVGARLRRKLEALRERQALPLPLFPEAGAISGGGPLSPSEGPRADHPATSGGGSGSEGLCGPESTSTTRSS